MDSKYQDPSLDATNWTGDPYFLPRSHSLPEAFLYGDSDNIDQDIARSLHFPSSKLDPQLSVAAGPLSLSGHAPDSFAGGFENDSDGEELVSEAESDFDLHDISRRAIDNTTRQSSRIGSLGGKRSACRRRNRDENFQETEISNPRQQSQRKSTDVGRSQRGAKRGTRKPLPPSEEFRRLYTEATAAFIDYDLDLAQNLASQAIHENPEMFIAHNLLSEIHTAQGDKARAVIALFNGAHTRPRDAETWSKVAEMVLDCSNDRASALEDAVYCYNRVIGSHADHKQARLRRAELNFEAGKKQKALYDYWKLLSSAPYDLELIHDVAKCCIGTPFIDKAVKCYEDAIFYYRSLDPLEVTAFDWSNANVYADLVLASENFMYGISSVKAVFRWLLGRADEAYWNDYMSDDREFDLSNSPRRIAVPEFNEMRYPRQCYGEGLPLELRYKLGIFRLRMGPDHLDEAMSHFAWLEPENTEPGSKIYNYADLFRDVADALKQLGHHKAALKFYEPLRQVYSVSEALDVRFWTDIATCYRVLQKLNEAEGCYKQILAIERSSVDAQMELAAMFDSAGLPERARPYKDGALTRRKRSYGRRMHGAQTYASNPVSPPPADEVNDTIEPDPELEDEDHAGLLKKSRKKLTSTTRNRLRSSKGGKRKPINHESLQDDFRRLSALKDIYDKNGQEAAKLEWMSLASAALDRFREARMLFPFEKHLRFYGYGRKARQRSWLGLKSQSQTFHVNGEYPFTAARDAEEFDEDEPESPETFAHVPFTEWLECFLQYAIYLAEAGDHASVTFVIRLCIDCIVWYHDPDTMFLIHVIHTICCIISSDHQALNDIMRFFMKEHQFVTDTYRLFAVVNRLCARDNDWYTNGPTQKFLLRQVKTVDFSLVSPKQRRNKIYEERAALSSKDAEGNPIAPTDFDVGLLMIYGHILYANQSYPHSLNYFYRAYALEPENPMVLLSLALAYIHSAVKRQADNRQTLIVQGLSFIRVYYEVRMRSPHAIERQEAEFNVGKVYHMLGLLHTAINYYERVLALGRDIEGGSEKGFTENFSAEAAFSLQTIWMQSNQFEKAKKITEEFLTI